MTATAEKLQEAPAKPVGIKRILPDKVKGVEYVSRDMSAQISTGTTLEEVLHPEFWTHMEGRLKEWGLIHCRWEDKTRYVLLMIIEASRTWAKVRVIIDADLEPPATQPVEADDPALADYKFQFIPNQGHRVVHKVTNNIIVHSLSSKSEAEVFLKNYIEDIKGK